MISSSDDMPLATSFGCIRPYVEADAEALARYANNIRIWQNLRDGFPHPYTLENANQFIQMVQRQAPLVFFAIAAPDEVIGGIGITPGQDVHRLTAELGYWLAEPYWGRGIMSEAVRRFSDWAMSRFGLVRIFAEPFIHNSASSRVLEKAGFQLEGVMRRHAIKEGRLIDMLLYAKVR
jgi:[ribosomal protein S5]-alanine N-acetyltransferase